MNIQYEILLSVGFVLQALFLLSILCNLIIRVLEISEI